MKYISIDLETTGLDENNCQILEFGAVLEDTNNILPLEDLPRYHAYIKHPKGNISGNIYALNLNADIIKKLKNEKELKDTYNYVKVDDLADDFLAWLKIQGMEIKSTTYNDKTNYHCTITVAGKNFASFDKKFLDKVPDFKNKIRIRHRIIDPAVLFVDWKNDEALPTLDECNARIGHNVPVQHTAVEDSIDVIRLLRKSYV